MVIKTALYSKNRACSCLILITIEITMLYSYMEGNLTLAGMHLTLAGNNRRVTLDPGRKYQKEIPEGNTRRKHQKEIPEGNTRRKYEEV